MLKAYNQKIIETPTYIEIWEYDQPIFLKKEQTIRNERLEWLNEKKNKKLFEQLSAQGQYDSLKRKQKHYKNMRFDIARLIDTNYDGQTKFLTLTFKENIQEIHYTNSEFKKFIKRLNYQLYKTKKSQIKYLATWEKQKRGAIHYHIILFHFPFIPQKRLVDIWGHGNIWINKIDVDNIENKGRYVSKYFDKDLDLKEHKKKAFFKSQNLKLPKEKKRMASAPYDTANQVVLYEKEYIRKNPVFSLNLNAQEGSYNLTFEESLVKYTKIRKGVATDE